MIQGLIDRIDNVEMLAFLKRRGVELSPESILTSNNLIAYLQYRNLGTQAAYAWLDLTKGDPDFIKAVLDWQAIRKERGFEFTPAYHLLFQATLVTKRDAEVWADLFKATFTTLGEQDQDRKVLMLVCLLYRWRDLKEVDPPLAERMAFLAEELQHEALTPSYRQLLHLALYQANFLAKDFVEAATWAEDIEPPTAGLALTFTAQILAKDLDTAQATVAQVATLTPENQKRLAWCHDVIRRVRRIEQSADWNETLQGTP